MTERERLEELTAHNARIEAEIERTRVETSRWNACAAASRAFRACIQRGIDTLEGGQRDAAMQALIEALPHLGDVIRHRVALGVELEDEVKWVDTLLSRSHALHAALYHPRTQELCDEALALRLRTISTRASR